MDCFWSGEVVQAVEWAWHGVKTCHAFNWGFEAVKGVLGDQCRDFATHAASQVGFVANHNATCFFDTLENRF